MSSIRIIRNEEATMALVAKITLKGCFLFVMLSAGTASADCERTPDVFARDVAAAHQMAKPDSLLSRCAIGGILSPSGMLSSSVLDSFRRFVERGICGAADRAVGTVRDPINDASSTADRWIRDMNTEIRNQEDGVFNDRHLPYGSGTVRQPSNSGSTDRRFDSIGR